MWTVRWCSHEGELRERQFKELRDALAEAAYLREAFEYVKVVRERGQGSCPA